MGYAFGGSALLGVGAALVLTLHSTWAGQPFTVEGTYLRNHICEGDGGESEQLRVKITKDQIFYIGGVCAIDDRKQSDATVTMRVTCKFKSGTVLSSSITFTKRDETTVDMAQVDGSYRAVLNRCPK